MSTRVVRQRALWSHTGTLTAVSRCRSAAATLSTRVVRQRALWSHTGTVAALSRCGSAVACAVPAGVGSGHKWSLALLLLDVVFELNHLHHHFPLGRSRSYTNKITVRYRPCQVVFLVFTYIARGTLRSCSA
jgi:hypothetical protein